MALPRDSTQRDRGTGATLRRFAKLVGTITMHCDLVRFTRHLALVPNVMADCKADGVGVAGGALVPSASYVLSPSPSGSTTSLVFQSMLMRETAHSDISTANYRFKVKSKFGDVINAEAFGILLRRSGAYSYSLDTDHLP